MIYGMRALLCVSVLPGVSMGGIVAPKDHKILFQVLFELFAFCVQHDIYRKNEYTFAMQVRCDCYRKD